MFTQLVEVTVIHINPFAASAREYEAGWQRCTEHAEHLESIIRKIDEIARGEMSAPVALLAILQWTAKACEPIPPSLFNSRPNPFGLPLPNISPTSEIGQSETTVNSVSQPDSSELEKQEARHQPAGGAPSIGAIQQSLRDGECFVVIPPAIQAGTAPLPDGRSVTWFIDPAHGARIERLVRRPDWLIESWSDRGKEIDRLQRIIQKLGKKNAVQHAALKIANETPPPSNIRPGKLPELDWEY